MVDENDSGYGLPQQSSKRPFSLRELIAFLDSAEHLGGDPAWHVFGFALSFNECNLEGGAHLETLWSFTSINSDFYPGLASHYSQLIDDWYGAREGNNGEPLIRHTLAIDEKHHRSEHPKVATDLYTLGRLLKDEERFDEAKPLMRRALIIQLKLARKSAHHSVSWLISATTVVF